MLADANAARVDTKRLHSNKQFSEEPRKINRLTNLTNAIKISIMNNIYKQVVVIGSSHGALLVHGAILKLKMDLSIDENLHLGKLTIITLSSPRFIPKGLLKNEKVFNFYNTQDKLIHIYRKCRFLVDYLEVPDEPTFDWISEALKDKSVSQSENQIKFEETNKPNRPNYKYKESKGVVFVKDIHLYCLGTSEVWESMQEHLFGWYHAIPYNLFPLLNYYAMVYTGKNKDGDFDSGFKKCQESEGTEGAAIGGKIKLNTKMSRYNIKKNVTSKVIIVNKK